MRKDNIFWGVLLVLVGAVLMANVYTRFMILDMEYLWPLFVLIPGLWFEYRYFAYRRDPGLLVPGGILLTIGCLFIFETITGWQFSEYTWPMYLVAVAFGLFQLYLATGRPGGLLVPVFILGGVALVAFASMLYGSMQSVMGFIVPAAMVILGLYLLFRRRK